MIIACKIYADFCDICFVPSSGLPPPPAQGGRRGEREGKGEGEGSERGEGRKERRRGKGEGSERGGQSRGRGSRTSRGHADCKRSVSEMVLRCLLSGSVVEVESAS